MSPSPGPGYQISPPVGGPAREGPRVDLRTTTLHLRQIDFIKRPGDGFYLYEESSVHPDVYEVKSGGRVPRDLNGWGRGPRIDGPDYSSSAKGLMNHPICFRRGAPLGLLVGIVATVPRDTEITLTLTPHLDGALVLLKPAVVSLALKAGTLLHQAMVVLDGLLPGYVGEHELQLTWTCAAPGFRFGDSGTVKTSHTLFTIYGWPVLPDDFEPGVLEAPRRTTFEEGTLTGTRKRLSLLMKILSAGGTDRPGSFSADAVEDLETLWWSTHVGINDTPGRAPHFNGLHGWKLAPLGPHKPPFLPETDQWLLWAPSRGGKHAWNSASCIGHVQLAKTMLAAIGIPVCRVKIYPKTPEPVTGHRVEFKEAELMAVEKLDDTVDFKNRQTRVCRFGERSLKARVALLEPDADSGGWEEFEACMRTKAGKLLPGGYGLANMPAEFVADRGFASARRLLSWWTRTKRAAFRRFLAWVFEDADGVTHFFDHNGTHYDASQFRRIQETGRDLPRLE